MFGRDDEVSDVSGMLATHQLVTVTGPGGVGKTRLAYEVARRAAVEFADGAWLVELAAITDPARVPDTVAVALSIQADAGEPLAGSLIGALGRRQLLLVLDNCEHVLAAVAEFCEWLLAVADDVRVLATSREPIGLPDEVRYRLPPLSVSVPGEDGGPGGSAAVTLFAARARQADPRLDLSGDAAPQVARLVARLDGMPLAIELAAARVEALGLSQLLTRLEESFGLLTSGHRSAHQRHRSLEATVRWSYELLDEQERMVFRRLAVFPGPFALDGAVAVAGPRAELAVLSLVDRSLITPPQTGSDGLSRYLILDTLRDFAHGELVRVGEHVAAEAQLAGYALDVAERTAADIAVISQERAAVRWFDVEYSMMEHAFRWCLEHEPATALRLALALVPWLNRRGHSAECNDLLNSAIKHAAPHSEPWCTAQIRLGETALDLLDPAGALGHFTAARDGLASGGPSPTLADALGGRADALINFGRVAEGVEDARQALAMSRDIGHAEGEVIALFCMTEAALFTEKISEAAEWARQAARIDPETYSSDTARGTQAALAVALMEAGDLQEARDQCAKALAAAREAGDLKGEAYCAYIIADLDLRSDDVPNAWLQLGPAVQLAMRGGQIPLRSCLSVGGELCALSGRWEEAVTVLAAHHASQHFDGRPGIRRRLDELLRRAAQELGPKRTSAAEERGTAMSLETAAEYLLLLTETGPPGDPAPDQTAEAPALPELSVRERELVTLVARGMTDAQIAGQLFISISTVRSHLDRIRDKTGARRRADLTRLALVAGLV
jgi:predicted ATPase/DNA-binding CsgD family transcriptional regulator